MYQMEEKVRSKFLKGWRKAARCVLTRIRAVLKRRKNVFFFYIDFVKCTSL